MQTRLSSWKNKLLNKPGGLALASSVLSSIPSYYMQINWLPQSICDSIDQTTRNFIWRGSNGKGIHLVGWEKIAKPKIMGGLGIRTARRTNVCLLGKLVWDMIQHSTKLWVQLLSYKYSTAPHFLLATAHPSCSPTLVAIIRSINILSDGFSWRHGNGASSFWFSNWNLTGILATDVPFVDIHDLHLTVKDVLNSPSPHTNILYTMLPPEVANNINNLNAQFNEAIEDSAIWSSNKNGVYTTKKGYEWLLSQSMVSTNAIPPHSWSWIWKLHLPEKYKFLV